MREFDVNRSSILPVGREWFRVLVFGMLLLPLGLMSLVMLVSMLWMEDLTEVGHWAMILFLGITGCVPSYFAVGVYLNSKGTTPKRALTIFYRNLSAGYYSRAQRHVLDWDNDNSFRRRPNLSHLEFTDCSETTQIGDKFSFESYWQPIFRISAL